MLPCCLLCGCAPRAAASCSRTQCSVISQVPRLLPLITGDPRDPNSRFVILYGASQTGKTTRIQDLCAHSWPRDCPTIVLLSTNSPLNLGLRLFDALLRSASLPFFRATEEDQLWVLIRSMFTWEEWKDSYSFTKALANYSPPR